MLREAEGGRQEGAHVPVQEQAGTLREAGEEVRHQRRLPRQVQ